MMTEFFEPNIQFQRKAFARSVEFGRQAARPGLDISQSLSSRIARSYQNKVGAGELQQGRFKRGGLNCEPLYFPALGNSDVHAAASFAILV